MKQAVAGQVIYDTGFPERQKVKNRLEASLIIVSLIA
jgi:hypothetical protein